MTLTRRTAAYGTVALALFFLAGIGIAYMATLNTPWAMAAACAGCLIAFALALCCYRRSSGTSSKSRYRLLLDAHEQVARLTGAGYDMLVPCEDHFETARLLICMEGENAVIKKQTWRGVWHFYTISPDGGMKREIWEIDGELTPADQEWLHGPLTSDRLEGLVTALRTSYSPRQRTAHTP